MFDQMAASPVYVMTGTVSGEATLALPDELD